MKSFLSSFFFFFLFFHLSYSQILWLNQTGGLGEDAMVDINSDSQGNVYSLGQFYGLVDFDPSEGIANVMGSGLTSVYIQKVNNQGEFLWVEVLLADFEIYARNIICDGSSNIYISGTFTETVDFDPGFSTAFETASGLMNSFLLKLNSEGDFQWVKTYQGNFNSIQNIKLTSSGDIVVCGRFKGTVDFDPGIEEENYSSQGEYDAFVQVLDSEGELIWIKTISSIDNVTIQYAAIDNQDDIYVSGNFYALTDFDPGVEIDYITPTNESAEFVLKLNNDGDFQWVNILESTNSSNYSAMKFDMNNSLVLVGSFLGSCDLDPSSTDEIVTSNDNSVFIQKFNIEGELQSYYTIGVNQGGISSGNMDIDSEGGLLISGSISSSEIDFDSSSETVNLEIFGLVSRYLLYLNEDYGFNFVYGFNAYGYNLYTAGVEVSNSDELYVAGHFQDSLFIDTSNEENFIFSNGLTDSFLIKFGFTLNIDEKKNILEVNLFPNPTSSDLNIHLAETGKYHYQLISQDGKILIENNFIEIESKIDLSNLPLGIYIIKISSTQGEAIKKIIIN